MISWSVENVDGGNCARTNSAGSCIGCRRRTTSMVSPYRAPAQHHLRQQRRQRVTSDVDASLIPPAAVTTSRTPSRSEPSTSGIQIVDAWSAAVSQGVDASLNARPARVPSTSVVSRTGTRRPSSGTSTRC